MGKCNITPCLTHCKFIICPINAFGQYPLDPTPHLKPTFLRGDGGGVKKWTPPLLRSKITNVLVFLLGAEKVFLGPDFIGFVWAKWDEHFCSSCNF